MITREECLDEAAVLLAAMYDRLEEKRKSSQGTRSPDGRSRADHASRGRRAESEAEV